MLGRLKKMPLRQGWEHEAHDFTAWLAEEENITLLGNELGIDITVLQKEAKVGNFTLDILAEDTNSEHKIIIENQLEPTDHDHLGKLLTYAAGYDARTVIWIAKDAREEHIKAVDWLNENTNEEVEFYLLQIELWQIDNSDLAPKFEILAKPNSWARTVRSMGSNLAQTETKLQQQKFWQEFKDYALANHTTLRLQKANPQHWFNIAAGSGEYLVSLTINSRENQLACEFQIRDNKDLYYKLYEYKEEIESQIGNALEWMELPERKASRVKITLDESFEDEKRWPEAFEWLQEQAEKFQKTFPAFL